MERSILNTTTLEWARLTPQLIVVANNAEAWIHHPDSFAAFDLFNVPMECDGSVETTRNLLEGALCAAQQAIAQERKGKRTPHVPLTLARWVWRLAGYYHTTHATPALMAEAAERFTIIGRYDLAEYANLKSFDEGGHDELALDDLRALGYDAERIVEILVPPTAASLVNYFTRLVRSDNPLGCIGYAYALERMAMAIQEKHIAEVEAVLPLGVHATRCLRVHSSVGDDMYHVEEAIAITAGLPPRERERIARVCYRTALLRHAAPQGEYLSEAALERKLAALDLKPQPAYVS